ncbi:MAG: BLUF domain-containing protein [Thermoanaerobaculales bacterium]|jgi:hypothetical protein|nr:BLUF domain-containing protein [Thermoanaerobaculales bacterium]
MMKRITYVSRYSKPMTADAIEALGRKAAEKNRELGLSGVLLTSGGLFYQVLEGPGETVDEIYKTILEDERHTDVILLNSESPIAERSFADWSMETIDLDAKAHVRLLPVKALMKAVFEQRRLADNMVGSIARSLWYEMRDSS